MEKRLPSPRGLPKGYQVLPFGRTTPMASHKPSDLYATLGVAKTASEKELRRAYRELARKYHPDVNKNNKEA